MRRRRRKEGLEIIQVVICWKQGTDFRIKPFFVVLKFGHGILWVIFYLLHKGKYKMDLKITASAIDFTDFWLNCLL
jgi:hypothetical protein